MESNQQFCQHEEGMQWKDIRAVELLFDDHSPIIHECHSEDNSDMLQQVAVELENMGPCTVILKCRNKEYDGTKNWPLSPSGFLKRWRNQFQEVEKEIE